MTWKAIWESAGGSTVDNELVTLNFNTFVIITNIIIVKYLIQSQNRDPQKLTKLIVLWLLHVKHKIDYSIRFITILIVVITNTFIIKTKPITIFK